jgi:hypothetical protein
VGSGGLKKLSQGQPRDDYIIISQLRVITDFGSPTHLCIHLCTMAPDLLDPSALITPLLNLLPSNKKRLESQEDAIVALIHSAFNALSFRLIAVDDTTLGSTTLNGILPEAWNTNGPGNYTLRYRHEQSSLEFIIKVIKLGNRTLINAIAMGVRDYPFFSSRSEG